MFRRHLAFVLRALIPRYLQFDRGHRFLCAGLHRWIYFAFDVGIFHFHVCFCDVYFLFLHYYADHNPLNNPIMLEREYIAVHIHLCGISTLCNAMWPIVFEPNHSRLFPSLFARLAYLGRIEN